MWEKLTIERISFSHHQVSYLCGYRESNRLIFFVLDEYRVFQSKVVQHHLLCFSQFIFGQLVLFWATCAFLIVWDKEEDEAHAALGRDILKAHHDTTQKWSNNISCVDQKINTSLVLFSLYDYFSRKKHSSEKIAAKTLILFPTRLVLI